MEVAEIIAIIQLVSVLEPQAVALITNLVGAFQASGMTAEDRQKAIDSLSAALKPMTAK